MSKYKFLIFGIFILSFGYVIRRFELFIPYNLVDKKDKQEILSKNTRKNFYFKDITKELNLTFDYQPPRISAIAYWRVDSLVQGPGAAVIDVNQDGFKDLFIVSPRENINSHLYISQDGTSFKESAEQFNLHSISNQDFFGLVPVFFDSDNDGDKDLYVSGIGCARFFENKDGQFIDKTQESQLGDCKSSQSAIFFDYDQDGLLDLYVLRYWGEVDLIHRNSPYVYINNLHNASNGGKNTLYRNMGNNQFKDITSIAGGGDHHWSYDAAYADIDDDGNFEIYISNDYGPDVIYRIVDEKLVDISDIFNVPDRRYGMNVSFLDLGEQKPGVYISNQYVGYGWSLYGNFFWQMKDQDSIKDSAKSHNLYNCKMAWGAAHGDFNLDGYEDLYVGNGYAPPREHYLAEENKEHPKTSSSFEASTFYYEWFLRALPGTVTEDIRNWSKLIRRGSRNDQEDCLFINHKNEYFYDMKKELSDVKIWNGKSVVSFDPKNSGVLDLLVSTNNGPVHYLKNTMSGENKNWIGFNLEGTISNRQAVGAKIIIKQKDHSFFRWNTGGRSGLLSTSDDRVHFGLFTSQDPVSVIVKWPNGEVQDFGSYQPGRYYKLTQESL